MFCLCWKYCTVYTSNWDCFCSRFVEPDPSHTLEERVVLWYFAQLDNNGSHDINKKEMKPFKRYVKKKAKPKRCARKFTDYCDLNKDKAISLQELKGCLGVNKEGVQFFWMHLRYKNRWWIRFGTLKELEWWCCALVEPHFVTSLRKLLNFPWHFLFHWIHNESWCSYQLPTSFLFFSNFTSDIFFFSNQNPVDRYY